MTYAVKLGEVSALFRDMYNDEILAARRPWELKLEHYGVSKPFSSGRQLYVPTMGASDGYEGGEDEPKQFSRLDHGQILLSTEYFPRDSWKVTDEYMEDIDLVPQLLAERAAQADYWMDRYLETTMLTTINSCHVANDANIVNGIASRIAASGAGNKFSINDFAKMREFHNTIESDADVCLVPPCVGRAIDEIAGNQAFVSTPYLEGLIETGITSRNAFRGNFNGYNIFVSNRLPSLGTELGVSNARPCLFLDVSSNQTKPFMYSWRRMPTMKVWYSEDDNDVTKYDISGRLFLDVLRQTTVGAVIVDETA